MDHLDSIATSNNHPLTGKYFQHRDGGIYRVTDTGFSTIDASAVVIYVHLFPFTENTWVRPASEWTPDRFREITRKEAVDLFSENRADMQIAITAAKEARKPPQHVCGLQGFGAYGDICPACALYAKK
jgi:hypothetical protein